MTSLTPTILPQPLTSCNLSMSRQTSSGSWKHKCQAFPHENSHVDPRDRRVPSFIYFSLIFASLCDPLIPSFHHSSVFLSRRPSLFPPRFLSLSPCGTQDLSTCLWRASTNKSVWRRRGWGGWKVTGPSTNTHKEQQVRHVTGTLAGEVRNTRL